MSKTPEVPYGNSFQLEEKWEFQLIEGSPTKTKLLVTFWAVVLKPFMMSKLVEDKSLEGMKEDMQIWIKEAKKTIQIDQAQAMKEKSQGKLEFEKSDVIEQGRIKQILSQE